MLDNRRYEVWSRLLLCFEDFHLTMLSGSICKKSQVSLLSTMIFNIFILSNSTEFDQASQIEGVRIIYACFLRLS